MAQCAGATQAQPVLRLLSVDGGMLRLGWPASLSGGFVVERSATAVVGSWTRASGAGVSGVIVGGEVETTQGIVSMPIEFFRLRSTQPDEPLVLVVRMAGSGALDAGLLSGLAAGAVILPGTNFADVLAAVPAAGATVLLDDGVFAGGVVVPARVTLRGRGPDRTRIVVAAGESRPALMVAGDDVTIEGVTLERLAGSGAALVAVTAERAALRNNVFISSASGLPLVNATAGSGHRVESNRFESVISMVGVLLASGSGHRVATNVFRAPGSAVVLQCGDSVVENNDFRNPGGDGAALVRLEGVTASGNVVSNNLLVSPGGVTVAIATGAGGNRVEANRLVPGDVLVEATAGSGNVVVNNALRTLIAVSAVPPPWVGEIVGGVAFERTNGVAVLWTGTISNAVGLIGSSGADLALGEGDFRGVFAVPSGTVLRGAGVGLTRLVAGTGSGGVAVQVVGTNVVLENLTLDGDRANVAATAPTTNGVVQVSGASATLRNVAVVNARHHGVVAAAGASGLVVEGSVLDNGATNEAGTSGWHLTALWSRGADNVVVRSNVIRGWGQAVVLHEGSTNGLVSANLMTNNFGYLNTAHTAVGAAVEDAGTSGVLHGWNQWVSNVVDGAAGNCLRVGNGVSESRVRGNVLRRAGQLTGYPGPWEVAGVAGLTNVDVVMEGNLVGSDGGRVGSCRILGEVTGLVVTNNVFAGFEHPSSLGPLHVSGGQGVSIVGNTMTRSRYGVWLDAGGAGMLVGGNTMSEVRGGEAVIYLAGEDGVRVETNYLIGGSAASGIKLVRGGGHVVRGNRGRVAGVAVLSQTGDNVIEANVFEETGMTLRGLVRLEGAGAVRNVVRGNVLVPVGGSPAMRLVSGAANNTVEGNATMGGLIDVNATAGGANTVNVLNAPVVFLVRSTVTQLAPASLGLRNLVLSNGVVVDFSDSIAGALAAVPATGATVLLGEGVFPAGGVQLTDGVVLRGQGRDRTKIVPLFPTQLPAVIVAGNGVTIEDLELNGLRDTSLDSTNSFGMLQGVVTVWGADANLRRVRVGNSLGTGILVTGPGLRVEDSLITNPATNNSAVGTPGGHGYGIFCSGADNVVLRSNVISGWAQGVGLWWGVTNGLVEHNRIVDNFGFIDAAHLINRSACEDYGADVVPHGANLWRSNLVDGSTSHCLEIAQGVAGSRFIGNVLRRPGQISNYGQHFEVTGQSGIETYDILVEGNDILSEGLRADECSVNGLASRVVVSNNVFSGFAHPASNGPLFLGGLSGVRDVTIVSNTFFASRFGVWVAADTTGFVIHGNLFTNPQRSDAVIHVASSGRGQVTGNLLTGTNFVAGIKLMGTGGNLISGNTVTLPAPALSCLSADNVVTNNTFTETTASLAGAIRLEGLGALRNRVTGNVVGSPDSRAILLLQGAADNIVTNNFITAGYIEVHPTAGLGNLVSGN